MKVAIILSGCGYLDGAEVTESVLAMLSLEKYGIDYGVFAPDIKQHHVVNHIDGSEIAQERNVLQEAARIARGKIAPLDNLNIDDYDGLVLAGGFGVAKNLTKIAFDKNEPNQEFAKLVNGFFNKNKIIAAICISPAAIASILGQQIKVTVGNDGSFAKKYGAEHIECNTDEICVDEKNKILSCPAYMHDDNILNIYKGIDKLISKIQDL